MSARDRVDTDSSDSAGETQPLMSTSTSANQGRRNQYEDLGEARRTNTQENGIGMVLKDCESRGVSGTPPNSRKFLTK